MLLLAGATTTTLAFFLAGGAFLLFAGALRLEAGAELEALEEGAFEANPFRPSDARSFSFSAIIWRRSCSLPCYKHIRSELEGCYRSG